jgi:hypothetical protein
MVRDIILSKASTLFWYGNFHTLPWKKTNMFIQTCLVESHATHTHTHTHTQTQTRMSQYAEQKTTSISDRTLCVSFKGTWNTWQPNQICTKMCVTGSNLISRIFLERRAEDYREGSVIFRRETGMSSALWRTVHVWNKEVLMFPATVNKLNALQRNTSRDNVDRKILVF